MKNGKVQALKNVRLLADRLMVLAALLQTPGCVRAPQSDKSVPLPLVPAALAYDAGYKAAHGQKVIAVEGERSTAEQPFAQEYRVSERFGTNDLTQLHERLNSVVFQEPLTNFSCGDPLPHFAFNLALYKRRGAKGEPLFVEWWCSPDVNPFGRDRCLVGGMRYLVAKAFAEIPAARHPDSPERVARKPVCETVWNIFPG